MALAKLEWQLITLAICTTLVTSAAALFVPHFQGAAFDAAIAVDKERFNRTALALLISSAGVSVFSAFKGVCFSLVGRRLAYKVRTGLLRNILSQDIAYFDGVNTGIYCRGYRTTAPTSPRRATPCYHWRRRTWW